MKILLTVLALSFVGIGSASASEFDWSACKDEVAKFCKSVSGDEKIYACLEENDSKLSAKCDETHGKYEEKTNKKK